MNHSNSPRALLGVALLAVCTSPRAEDETLTVVGKRSQHAEVATATRTATPAKLVPQSIESVKASELTAFGQPTRERGPDRHPWRQRQRRQPL